MTTSALVGAERLITADTVEIATPALWATSLIVDTALFLDIFRSATYARNVSTPSRESARGAVGLPKIRELIEPLHPPKEAAAREDGPHERLSDRTFCRLVRGSRRRRSLGRQCLSKSEANGFRERCAADRRQARNRTLQSEVPERE